MHVHACVPASRPSPNQGTIFSILEGKNNQMALQILSQDRYSQNGERVYSITPVHLSINTAHNLTAGHFSEI